MTSADNTQGAEPGKGRILIVEDDRAVAKMFSRQLMRNGFVCERALSASEARRQLNEQRFDLILCDIMMPEENGIELIRQIKRGDDAVATIMVTGNDDPLVAQQALELGIYGLLLKPVSQNQLIVSIENALCRARLEKENRSYLARLEERVQARTASLQATLSELQHAQQALEASQANLRLFKRFSDAALQGFAILTPQLRLHYANDALLRMAGISDDGRVRGKSFLRFQAAGTEQSFTKDVLPCILDKGSWGGELDLVARDGRVTPTHQNYFTISGGSQAVDYIAVVVTDMTEHRQLADALRASRSSFKAIVERSTEAILVTDLEGTILFVNPAAELIFGKTTADLMDEPFGHGLASGQSFEIDIIRPGEQLGKGDMRVSQTKWEGQPAYLVSIRDITERVKMETALKETADDLKWTVDELEAANRRIVEQQKSIIEQERLKVLLQMAGATAHELNQPLTTLLGRIELMEFHQSEPEKLQADIAHISEAGSRIASIVKKIQTIRSHDIHAQPSASAIIHPDQDIKILSVEDKRADFLTVKSQLGDFSNIHLSHCRRQETAFKRLSHESYDLIFLDYVLPDGFGSDFLDRMQQQGLTIPVIVVTGQGDEMVASKMIQSGAYDYLPKHLISKESLVRVVSNALEKARLRTEVHMAMEKMAEMSTRDELTGLYNRRYFSEALETEMARAERYHTRLSLCMLDIDYFKKVNDTYGHPAGDHALKEVSLLLRRKLRQSDIACRYGGEEFAVILPNTGQKAAFELCERFRELLANHRVAHEAHRFHITVSIGVAGFSEQNECQPDDLIAKADNALYAAKQKGRNRVESSDDG